jgi:hypothetical protein
VGEAKNRRFRVDVSTHPSSAKRSRNAALPSFLPLSLNPRLWWWVLGVGCATSAL